MAKPPSSSGSTNLASCVVATIFLIFLFLALFAVYLTLFRPQDPEITVSAVQLPSFSAANGTVSFTFSQYASVRNPNRAVFSHYDSSLQLIYSGKQIGFMFIPAGTVDARSTKNMAATFNVQSFPLSLPPQPPSSVGSAMEMESRIEMAGRVRVLQLFSHHVEAKAGCRVAVSVSDGSVLGLHC